MATLDRVIEMQNQGMSEYDIAEQLKNEGINPKEITDALGQAKIKNAVSPNAEQQAQQQATQEQQPTQNMQPSVMQDPNTQGQYPEQYQQPQQNPEVYPQENQAQDPYASQQEQQNYYSESPQAYSGQEYYPNQGNMTSETISEIAEQVVSEKLEEFKIKTGDLQQFKNSTEEKLNNFEERLKRIEDSIEKIEQAVIGKIGEFGENSATIKKDLENLHGTVSKLMNPLIDNINELKKANGKK